MDNQEDLNAMKRYSEMSPEDRNKILEMQNDLVAHSKQKAEYNKNGYPSEEKPDDLEKEKTGVSEKISMPGLQQALINEMGSSFGQELRRIDNDEAITKIINRVIKVSQVDTNQISDGYHTFYDLYEHRIALFIALCKNVEWSKVWKSIKHSDGTEMEGWFIMGIGKEAGQQITYHLPDFMWEECEFAETLNKAPEFDGHTSTDVLLRLKDL